MKKDKSGDFTMLKTITLLFKVIAWLALFGGLIAAIEILAVPGTIDKLGLTNIFASNWLMALAMLIGTVIYSMIFFAVSETIQVFLSIEQNTRKLKDLLDRK